jgi:hypothetical protein
VVWFTADLVVDSFVAAAIGCPESLDAEQGERAGGSRPIQRRALAGLACPGTPPAADGKVAQAHHGAGTMAGADLAVVLAEGDITYPVQPVLGLPVARSSRASRVALACSSPRPVIA